MEQAIKIKNEIAKENSDKMSLESRIGLIVGAAAAAGLCGTCGHISMMNENYETALMGFLFAGVNARRVGQISFIN